MSALKRCFSPVATGPLCWSLTSTDGASGAAASSLCTGLVVFCRFASTLGGCLGAPGACADKPFGQMGYLIGVDTKSHSSSVTYHCISELEAIELVSGAQLLKREEEMRYR